MIRSNISVSFRAVVVFLAINAALLLSVEIYAANQSMDKMRGGSIAADASAKVEKDALFRDVSKSGGNDTFTSPEVNRQTLVSRADLDYSEPTSRSDEGMPLGNGRMGSLVWTTPSALKFQINRVDVFGCDATTVSFPDSDSDYASGCGYVDINLAGAGGDVFVGKEFNQHLSVYDGMMQVKSGGVAAHLLGWPQRDVIAVEIDDQRRQPDTINIDLRMLRYAIQRVTGRNYDLAVNHSVLVRTAEHTALSKLDIRDGRILLIQQFQEQEFYDSSAVAISVIGRASRARYMNESTVQLSVAPGKGRFTIFISSAASFDPKVDVGALAAAELQAAETKGFAALQTETTDWWHGFWSRGFVYMHSAEGQADFVEANYTYFLYLMGASSRGTYPPRYGGMLWRTSGDMARWGSQYWWANTAPYYNSLLASNHPELLDPMFSMFTNMYDACALAARQQWGSQGIWIPETGFFSGPERLPDDIAAELKDLMLVRKPYSERSAKFQWWAETKNRYNSRWNFLTDGHWDHGHRVANTRGGRRDDDDSGKGTPSEIFGYTTHTMSDAARIAKLYYDRYEFTLDKEWLRDRAYPMIKGAAEFYRSFPYFQKGDDGKYHLHHVNNWESAWNSSDPAYEIAMIRMIIPLAIHASEILGVDQDLRPVWQEIVDNLVSSAEPRNWAKNRPFGAFVGRGSAGVIEPFGPEPELKRRFLGFQGLDNFIDPQGSGGAQVFRNRLRLREGYGAMDAEHLGGLSSGINSTMLNSAPNVPGGESVMKLFNDWPKDWDAAFSLLAEGAFLISSSFHGGKVEFVEIRSQVGGVCRLNNPWPDANVILHRNGKLAESLSGDVLTLPTIKGEVLLIAPKDVQ